MVSVIAILRIRFAGALTAAAHDTETKSNTITIEAKGIFQVPPKCVTTTLIYIK